ncbi:MAG: hypothetical protein AAB656_00200 [Patescibacteria group bacterium]
MPEIEIKTTCGQVPCVSDDGCALARLVLQRMYSPEGKDIIASAERIGVDCKRPDDLMAAIKTARSKNFDADEYINNLSVVNFSHQKPNSTEIDPELIDEEIKNKFTSIILDFSKLEQAGKTEEAIQKMRELYPEKDELIKNLVNGFKTLNKYAGLFDKDKS